MKFKRRYLIRVFPPILLALLIVFVWVAGYWLESSGGNKLLQTELSKSLGFPVQLNDDYRLKFFPQLEIAGSGLVILQKNGAQVLARSESYSVAIELRPLLSKEIRISSITLTDGFMDFRDLPPVAPNPLGDDQSLDLPHIDFLGLENFRLYFSEDQSVLEVKSLQLSDFQPGEPSEISIIASFVSDTGEQPQFDISGLLAITPNASVITLEIQDMQFDLNEFRAEGITGRWQWDQRVKELTGSLNGSWEDHQLGLTVQLLTGGKRGDLFSGKLQSEYRHPELPEHSSVAMDFSADPGVIHIQLLEALVMDQALAGTGCIMLTDPVRINLILKAGELDLDAIYSLIPVDAEDESGHGDVLDLPFTPAIVLHVDKTLLAGAVASDVQIEIGDAPDCPETGVKP